MKRVAVLAVGVLVALGLMPATAGAGAALTGQVTIVHDATFNAPGSPFPVTVCIDGEPFAGGVGQEPFVWGDILGPLELPVDTYDIAVYGGAVEACEGEPAIGPLPLAVSAGDDVTLAAILTNEGLGAALWTNDNSCVDPGVARVTVRHGADTNGPITVVSVDGETETVLIPSLAEGGQAVLEVPGGVEIPNIEADGPGLSEPYVVGSATFPAGLNTVIYLGGGGDGTIGEFIQLVPIDTCSTPTTAAPVTTVAPAARAAAATPRFTG